MLEEVLNVDPDFFRRLYPLQAAAMCFVNIGVIKSFLKG